MKRRIVIVQTLGAGLLASTAAHASGILDSLFGKRGTGDGLLPPEKAFMVRFVGAAAATVHISLEPAPGYYLYRDRIAVKVLAPQGIKVRELLLPRGEVKDDPTFGRVEVFRRPVQASAIFAGSVVGKQLRLEIAHQGCEERRGVCYPPAATTLVINMP